ILRSTSRETFRESQLWGRGPYGGTEGQRKKCLLHRRTPFVAERPEHVLWQIATARASVASNESKWGPIPSSECTIICTWRFSARPYPTTLIFTSSGEYSFTVKPASA